MSTNRKITNKLKRQIGPITFGMFLRTARLSKDLSQAEMGRFLGISRASVCDIEKGRQMVSPALAARIAKKVGLSLQVAVAACLQDQINKAKLGLIVNLKAS